MSGFDRRRARFAATAALTTMMLGAVGCGGGERATDPPKSVTVVLDWSLNPAHAGLVTAIDGGLDRRRSVALRLRTPPSSSDGVRLLLAGRADFAVLDIHDLAIAGDRGRDLVAVMAVIGRPLASVIAAPDVGRPRDLEGRSVAITGTPSDRAVVEAIVRADGGDPSKVRLRPSGWATTAALLGGRTDAAVGFANEEGVSVRSRDPRYRVFQLDRSGAPRYPELVLVTLPRTVERDPQLVEAVVAAVTEGSRIAVADPQGTVGLLSRRLRGADRDLLRERTAAALALMVPPNGRAGSLDPKLLADWARWEAASGIVGSAPDTDRIVDTRFSGE